MINRTDFKKEEKKVVLGVDPGLAITGIAVLKTVNSKVQPLLWTCIKTSSKMILQERLLKIYESIKKIIDEYKPDIISMEELFFPSRYDFKGNVQYPRTIMHTGQVRGLIFLLAGQKKLQIAEYKPKSIKVAVTGYGNADKLQVQNMIRKILSIKEKITPDDISDAIAVALCHINTLKFKF